MAQFAENAQWAEISTRFAPSFGWREQPRRLSFKNDYLLFTLGNENAIQYDSIVWASRWLKTNESRDERIAVTRSEKLPQLFFSAFSQRSIALFDSNLLCC